MATERVIKICGIKSIADVNTCLRCGVTAVGLNFYSASPRYVSMDQAIQLRDNLRQDIQALGVFVRPIDQELRLAIERVRLDAVQIHGADETYLRALQPLAVPVWLVQGIATADDVQRLKDYARLCESRKINVGALLVDAKSEDVHGGSGKTLPWDVLQNTDWDAPLILSGGLTPENVAEAIRQVKPQGVDVASGVESAPGVKDAAKIEAFVAAARNAFKP